MHRAPTILCTLTLLLALAAPAAAADHITLKDGTVLHGRATAYDSQKKQLSFRTDAGTDVVYPIDQLDQRSVYLVNTSLVPQTSGKGQLQLANYARDIGLYAHAARRYGYAEKADPSLKPEIDKERAIGRKLAAEYCMKNAQSAIAKKDIKDAEKWLTLLVQKLPDEPQAVQAASMLDTYYAKQRNARDDQLEKDQSALLQSDLKQGKMLYDRMIERTHQGLTARSSSQSQKLFEGAIADGNAVLSEIDRIQKKYPDDPKVQDGAAEYRALTIDQMVDAHLNLASYYSVKSSYNAALKETNAALALSPKNPEALAQRARIEQAASEGLGLAIF